MESKMKEIVVGTLIFALGAWTQAMNTVPAGAAGTVYTEKGWVQQDQMTVPKVTHEKHETTQTYTTTKMECPAGYEGHFVDQYAGFESHFEMGVATWGQEGAPAFALCFKKDFMDGVRKNPDLSTYRPSPPRAVQYTIPATPSWAPMPSTTLPATIPNTWGTCTLLTTNGICTTGITTLTPYSITSQ
jgi:hypothetical protein